MGVLVSLQKVKYIEEMDRRLSVSSQSEDHSSRLSREIKNKKGAPTRKEHPSLTSTKMHVIIIYSSFSSGI
ncbi:MAG: hypothetical protein A4E55_02051 [Pelotomaculum sp. PtaU1.Bin035]|nr:MAG: hypothetical protein A4E55_02051 [Pelotomaculum sp. PtaU1.Bin035]